jgi:hypothetical protein
VFHCWNALILSNCVVSIPSHHVEVSPREPILALPTHTGHSKCTLS